MQFVGLEVVNLVDALFAGKTLVIKEVMAIWYSGLTENITVDSGLGDEFISRRSKTDLMSTGENKIETACIMVRSIFCSYLGIILKCIWFIYMGR